MLMLNTRRWGRFLLFLLALTLLGACLGKLETKPVLTAPCRLNWQQQAGLAVTALPDSTESDTLKVLVFNIHDRLLPDSLFSSHAHTEEEVACIGDLASKFDLVLFQEAFVRPAQLAREQAEAVHAEPYEAFAGWNTDLNKADDFFSKGFQLVKFPTFWVLNSHMDAGRGKESIEARSLQLKQITEALGQFLSPEAPLLIGMDANLRPDREERDAEVFEEFLHANALTLVHQNGPDLVAVRGIRTDRPQTLPFKGVLSDHNALSIIISQPSASE